MRPRFSVLAFTAAMATSTFAPSVHAADPACKPVMDAMEKLVATPNHQFQTETGSFRKTPMSSETITTGNTLFVLVNGKWSSMPFNAQQALKDMQQSARSAKATCKYLRDEAINGEAAALYSSHNATDYGTSDQHVWISKSRGLPLRQIIDISEGKAHHEVRYEYANVQAPAGKK